MAVTQWGWGAAKLVAPATREQTEVVVFLSDLHVPFHDEAVVDAAVRLIEDVRPHRVVLNGDVADFFQLSRFNTGREREDQLQEEIDAANAIRRRVREAAPDATLDETEGNHDNRVQSFVRSHAKALGSLRALHPRELFHWRELDIRGHPGAGFLLRRWFLVKHGDVVRSDAMATAKAELLKAGLSGVSGHTHRLGTYRRAAYRQLQWTEQGCMCRLEPDYVVGPPNWTQGIAVGEFSRRQETFAVHEVPFVDGRLRLGLQSF